MSDKTRADFEAFAGSPPFEYDLHRIPNDPDRCAWPGQYDDLTVEFAWQCWLASRKQAMEEAAAICDGVQDDAHPQESGLAAVCASAIRAEGAGEGT